MNDTYEGPRGKLARRLKGEPVWALESWSEANLEIRARMMLKEEIPVSLLQVALSSGFGVESLAVWAGLSGCSLKEQLGELLLLTERAGESRLGKAVLELKDELAYWDEVNHGRPWSKANSRGRPEPGQVELIERERKEIQRRLDEGEEVCRDVLHWGEYHFSLVCDLVGQSTPRWLGSMWGQLHAVDAACTTQGAKRGAEWLRFMGLKGRVCVQRSDFLWKALWENAARIQALQLCWKDLVLSSWDPNYAMKRFAGPKLVYPEVLNPGRVSATVKKLRRHLERHSSGGESFLASGSLVQEVKRVEESIGMQFPADFVEFLCAQGGTDAEFGPIGLYGWLTLETAFQTWRVFRSVSAGGEELGEDPIGPMKQYFLHPGWFPFIGHGSGTHVCVDLAPEHGGIYGQIVQVPDAGVHGEVLASGISEWLEIELNKIESGQYVWDHGIYCEEY